MNDMFDEVRQDQELFDTEGKHAAKCVVKNGIHYCLCGTPLAIEEEVESRVIECFETLADIFHIPYNDDDAVDYVSDVRDKIIESFESLVKGKVIYGYVEY